MAGAAVIDGLHLPTTSNTGRSASSGWLHWGLCLACVAVTAAETAIAVAYFAGMFPATVALALHVAIVVVLWRLHRRASAPSPSGLTWPSALFVLTTAALGPVGAVGALISALLQRAWLGRAARLPLWLPPELTDDAAERSRDLYRRLSRHADAGGNDASRVAPFADVLARGSAVQKQAVVALIASRFQPAFAPVLLSALNDTDASVRVLAAAAAARIENEYLPVSMNLEERHNRQLSDFGTKWMLASHYDQYANTGVLDAGRILSARLRALELYRQCIAMRPWSTEVLHATIRLLVRLGRDEEATAVLAPFVARGGAPAETLTWYIESLFKRGRYAPLRDACRLLEQQPAALALLTQACRDTVTLWAADEQPV